MPDQDRDGPPPSRQPAVSRSNHPGRPAPIGHAAFDIDSWIRDGRIRRDFLIGLTLVLLTIVLVLHSAAAQVICAAAAATWSGTRLIHARRNRKR